MKTERQRETEPLPRMPAKSKLSWRICRLNFDEAGGGWWATGSKGEHVAVIRLPELADPAAELEWVAEIEARFAEHAADPCSGVYLAARASPK